jgi:phosphocarrier protein
MNQFSYTITDALGIHARPAGMLVKQAQGFASAITISCGGKQADLKRLLAVMTMGIRQGQRVEVSATGADEEAAAAALEEFFKSNL